MAGLATRFAHRRTVFIPDTVRYTVAGYDSARPDRTDNTGHHRWDAAVGQTEAITGITMAAIWRFPGAEYSGFMGAAIEPAPGRGSPEPRCWTGPT